MGYPKRLNVRAAVVELDEGQRLDVLRECYVCRKPFTLADLVRHFLANDDADRLPDEGMPERVVVHPAYRPALVAAARARGIEVES